MNGRFVPFREGGDESGSRAAEPHKVSEGVFETSEGSNLPLNQRTS